MTVTAMPTIYVSDADYERLANLAECSDSHGARLLRDELERAVVVSPDDVPCDVVRLHATISFTEVSTGRRRVVELVPPEQADIDKGRVSVLSPVGAALLGMPSGASIRLVGEDGRPHMLTVDAVGFGHATA